MAMGRRRLMRRVLLLSFSRHGHQEGEERSHYPHGETGCDGMVAHGDGEEHAEVCPWYQNRGSTEAGALRFSHRGTN
jgi:hypothetical protein